jgi:hypothetical protein
MYPSSVTVARVTLKDHGEGIKHCLESEAGDGTGYYKAIAPHLSIRGGKVHLMTET